MHIGLMILKSIGTLKYSDGHNHRCHSRPAAQRGARGREPRWKDLVRTIDLGPLPSRSHSFALAGDDSIELTKTPSTAGRYNRVPAAAGSSGRRGGAVLPES